MLTKQVSVNAQADISAFAAFAASTLGRALLANLTTSVVFYVLLVWSNPTRFWGAFGIRSLGPETNGGDEAVQDDQQSRRLVIRHQTALNRDSWLMMQKGGEPQPEDIR